MHPVSSAGPSDGRAVLLGTLATLVLITVATNTTASLAQPQIGAEFGVGPADTGWVVFGYSATFAVATALYGGIAARIGITPALVSGVTLLGLGSVAAALAPSMEALVASRLVQGLGSGAIPTLSTALIARRFDGHDRGRAFGVIVAAVGGGQAVGPILGGLLLEFAGWRAAVSIGAVAIVAVGVLWATQRGRAEARPPAEAMDFAGAALVALGVLGLAFLLNRGPLLGLAPVTVVPLVLLAVIGVGLVRRVATVPRGFAPRRVVGHPVFGRVAMLGAVGMSAYLGCIVLVPIVGARAYGLDGIALGLLLLPMAIAAAISSPNASRIEQRLGSRLATRLALSGLGLGALGLALGAQAVGPAALLVALALLGSGFGLLNAPLLNELTHSIAGSDQPIAVGLYNLCFFMGGTAGAAVTSSLVQVGVDLPGLGGSAVPGFSSAVLLVALLPLALAAFGVSRLRAAEGVA